MMKPHPPGAVASLVCGILAIILGAVPFLGIVLGIIAIIAASRARSHAMDKPDAYQGGGLHTAGLVTGIIGTVMSSLATLWSLLVFSLIAALIAAAAHGMAHPPVSSAPVPML